MATREEKLKTLLDSLDEKQLEDMRKMIQAIVPIMQKLLAAIRAALTEEQLKEFQEAFKDGS